MKNITPAQQKMLDLFDNHVNAELAGDLETTMATMTDNPHLINVAVLMGGSGKEGVRTFYRNYLVGKFFPPDVEMINVSRTVDDEQIVDEVVIKFTHTTPVDWMLPEVAPTGKRVEVALVVVVKVEDGKVSYENLDGEFKTEEFDFAMLIPAFSGHGFKAYDKNNNDITDKLFKGFMIVDADYTPKTYEEWRVQDWPETYQNPSYENIFAPGIAFAPPHAISKPRKSKNGTDISPSPPRTGMPSGITAKLVADNIIDAIENGKLTLHHKGSMGNMGAACIASAGYGATKGSGVSITTYPIVPDYVKYKETQGRDIKKTFGDIGLAGHWLKLTLHYAFIYKAKMKPFWWLIPE